MAEFFAFLLETNTNQIVWPHNRYQWMHRSLVGQIHMQHMQMQMTTAFRKLKQWGSWHRFHYGAEKFKKAKHFKEQCKYMINLSHFTISIWIINKVPHIVAMLHVNKIRRMVFISSEKSKTSLKWTKENSGTGIDFWWEKSYT